MTPLTRRLLSLSFLPLLALAPVRASAAEPAPTLRARAEASLRRLETQRPRLRVQWQPNRATPALVTGLAEDTGRTDAREAAEAFLTAWPDLVPLAAQDRAWVETVGTRDRRVVRFEQRVGGLPVRGRSVAVTLDAAGRVLAVASDAEPLNPVAPATLTVGAACDAARGALAAKVAASMDVLRCGEARALIVANGAHGVPAYEIPVAGLPVLADIVVLVDGTTGDIFDIRDRLSH